MIGHKYDVESWIALFKEAGLEPRQILNNEDRDSLAVGIKHGPIVLVPGDRLPLMIVEEDEIKQWNEAWPEIEKRLKSE